MHIVLKKQVLMPNLWMNHSLELNLFSWSGFQKISEWFINELNWFILLTHWSSQWSIALELKITGEHHCKWYPVSNRITIFTNY